MQGLPHPEAPQEKNRAVAVRVVGRKAGTEKGFKYSKGMRKSGITWDDAALDAFLKKPRKFVKGTRMSFPGLKKKADRDNVIAYLKEHGK